MPMSISLTVKIIIFILLAVFATWPYYENFLKYHWAKRILIGLPILLLIILGILDIKDSDEQAKKDKKEINKLSEKIANLLGQVTTLSTKLDSMNQKADDRQKHEDASIKKQLNKIAILILSHSEISRKTIDTSKK